MIIEDDDGTIIVNPPSCIARYGHVWNSPHALVGGDERNPGWFVSYQGGYFQRVCACCGQYRTTYIWPPVPEIKQPSIEVMRFYSADAASLVWAWSNLSTSRMGLGRFMWWLAKARLRRRMRAAGVSIDE